MLNVITNWISPTKIQKISEITNFFRHYFLSRTEVFFSTKTSMSGEEVLRTYRSRFQIEFCFRDAKQYTGLTHCQARHKNQLDFSYNASFASQNVAKVMMKENELPYSMASFKEIMASTYIAKLIFNKCRRIPNRKLISHTIKELFGWQRKAA